ncbi:MAG TPA: hypothetical protein VN285_00140 [Candidatus Deferrimicrobium sp.]|nr:hypothetical protein [Candidatus Deferrimicrobium sp.]
MAQSVVGGSGDEVTQPGGGTQTGSQRRPAAGYGLAIISTVSSGLVGCE